MKPRSSSFSALYFTFLIALLPLTLQASGTSDFGDNAPAQQEEGAIDTQEKISAYIEHHIKDAHDFHLFSYNDSEGHRKHFGFPLPVIVYTSQGVRAFMSSAFHHDDSGHYIVEKEGVSLVKYHEKIYELNQGEDQLSFDADHHPENAHAVLDLSITKSVFGFLLVSLLLLFGFRSLANQYKKRPIPVGLGRVLEPLVLYVRDEIARPNIGEKHYKRFTGFLLTVFFFIWASNLLGLTPLGFNITGQLAVTFTLALFTYVITQFSGNKDYWKHIFWMPGVPAPMKVILAPIELLGTITKPFSLMIRLF
ncbi:MAG: F0F1 ATP synthase subunit A, partial [Bacteroidetes bacterium]|nr:F0F1 ATP synthase subunit A [Bacteroidota bacterium]